MTRRSRFILVTYTLAVLALLTLGCGELKKPCTPPTVRVCEGVVCVCK